jgi:transposase
MGTNRAGLAAKRRLDGRGRPWQDTRAVLSGVRWVLGTAAQWRELPDRYPPFQTCQRRFQQWVRNGKLEKALGLLARRLHERGKLGLREAFIDATFASAKKGSCRRSYTPRQGDKIVAIAADNSLPLAVSVQSASPHETQLVEEALAGSFLDEFPARLVGDRAYDSDSLTRSSQKNTASHHIERDGARRTRMVGGCGFIGNAGMWSGYLLGCTGLAGSSLVMITTSKMFSVWSSSPVSCSC